MSSWRRILSPRLRESATTTVPLTHLYGSLAREEIYQVFFSQMAREGWADRRDGAGTETLQQPVLLLGCGGSMESGVLLVALCIAWP